MMKKLSVENPFFDFMGRLGDIVLLNLLFLAFSLPVVTIGASFTALYQSLEEMAEGEFISAYRNFTTAFKKHVMTGMKVWLVLLATGGVLMFDLIYLGSVGVQGNWGVVSIGVGCLLVLWEMAFCHIFRVLLTEEGRAPELLKKSMFQAVKNFPYTLLMMILNSIPLVCFMIGGALLEFVVPLYLVFGFAATAFANTFFLRRCV